MANKHKPLPRATINLALLWAQDEITTKDVQEVLASNSLSYCVYTMGVALRDAVRQEILVLKVSKK